MRRIARPAAPRSARHWCVVRARPPARSSTTAFRSDSRRALRSRHVGSSFDNATNTRRVEGYDVVDLRVGYPLTGQPRVAGARREPAGRAVRDHLPLWHAGPRDVRGCAVELLAAEAMRHERRQSRSMCSGSTAGRWRRRARCFRRRVRRGSISRRASARGLIRTRTLPPRRLRGCPIRNRSRRSKRRLLRASALVIRRVSLPCPGLIWG